MDNDAILLRRFAEEGAEAAFAELVARHLDLVYAAALRRTGGDAHRAADIAQQVFTALARQAPKLRHHTVLSAWLHTATRNIAINVMLSEKRRKSRESAAVTLASAEESASATNWDAVRPVLDTAIDELPTPDRTAVVLRFLERRSFGDIGDRLGISADAARMRTERALEKLRTILARQGITSSAAALGALVSAQAGGSAPAGLAATIVSAAVPAASAGAGALVGAGTLFMSTKIALSAASLAAAVILGFYLGLARSNHEPLPPLPPTPEQLKTIAGLRQENLRLRAETDRLNAARLTVTPAETPAVAPPRPTVAPGAAITPLPALTVINQQRAMLNNLRMISAARDQFYRENQRDPASINDLVGETKYIRQLNPVAGESYANLLLAPKQLLTVVTPEGTAVTYDPVGNATTDLSTASRQANAEVQRALTERFGAQFVERVSASAQKAATAYRAAHGQPPPTPLAVLPYFETPQAGADFVEFSEAAKALGVKM